MRLGIAFGILVVKIRGKKECVEHGLKYWKKGIVGGVLSISAYEIILWAMTKSPMGYVSALQETSAFFGSIIAVIFLGEKFKINRMISAILIVCGAIIMRF